VLVLLLSALLRQKLGGDRLQFQSSSAIVDLIAVKVKGNPAGHRSGKADEVSDYGKVLSLIDKCSLL
jgi:hypothetical protein